MQQPPNYPNHEDWQPPQYPPQTGPFYPPQQSSPQWPGVPQQPNTHDQTEEHQSGDVYLDIQSEGAWTIQIQEFQ